jgi:AcrR family transcriptional regulator
VWILAAEDTKEKILDAAEELFADHGFSATSIRAITTNAGVNLAALNYHFGSKDALIDAVFERRLTALNRQRIRLLDQLELNTGEEELNLEDALKAFLSPAIHLASDPSRGGEVFMRLMGRAHTEPGEFFLERIAKHFREVFGRFGATFRRLLPHLSAEELYWRFHFVVGSMAITMSHKLALRYLKSFEHLDGKIDPQLIDPDDGVVLERLVAFAAAGLRAGIAESAEVGK